MRGTIRIGIVGSRTRNGYTDSRIVLDLIQRSVDKFGKENVTIVSGACSQGADHFARVWSDSLGVKIDEYPVPPGASSKFQYREWAFERNRKIAENCDVLFALVLEEGGGGTWNTVGHAQELGKKVFLVDHEGRVYLSQDGSPAHKT